MRSMSRTHAPGKCTTRPAVPPELLAPLAAWKSRLSELGGEPAGCMLCIAALGANFRFCRVASADWRPGRVYFLTLLEPLAGTTGLWPLPPGRPVPATVGGLDAERDRFTAHAAGGPDQTVADDLVIEHARMRIEAELA